MFQTYARSAARSFPGVGLNVGVGVGGGIGFGGGVWGGVAARFQNGSSRNYVQLPAILLEQCSDGESSLNTCRDRIRH